MSTVSVTPKHRPVRRLGRAGLVLAAVAVTLLISPLASAHAAVHTGNGPPTENAPRPATPTVNVGASPFGIVIDHRTGSVYVADDNGVAVINGAMCNAHVSIGCERTPIAVPAGNGGIGITLDQTTNTVYVANGADDTVSVVDAVTCNAVVTSGCADAHPAIRVGSLPSHLAIDYATQTLYVANEDAESPGNTVSMIDTSVCNGHVTAGCGLAAPTVTTGGGPDGLTVDARTHTLYVSNGADTTVSVIDTARCNSHVQTGCAATSPTLRLPGASVGGVLDADTHTLFEPTSNSVAGGDAAGTLSIIDTSTCNASVLTGCNQTPRQIDIGSGPIDAAENPLTHRVYVVNEEDSDVSVVDIARCNAVHSDGCHGSSPTMSIGFDGGAVAVDTTTDTIYASSQDRGTITVLHGASCTDTRSSGCRHPAPTTAVGTGPAGSTLVDSTGTLYVANQQTNTVSVIDTHACNNGHLVGCHRSWPTITVGEFPMTVAADEALDALYVPNLASSTVSVINARTCNAQTTAGCGQTTGTVSVSGGAYTLTVDPQTQTVYVANIDSDTVSIINARSCNARITSGCNQTPVTVRTGTAPAGLQLDPSTHTLYVANRGDHTVSLIDTTRCNATTSVGCATPRPTVPIVAAPRFMAISARTATLYVSTKDDSSLAMIDTTRCNALNTSGCTTPRVVHVGYLPYQVAIDPRSGDILVGDVGDSTISIIDGTACNAQTTIGCQQHTATIETGGWPTNLTIDASTTTAYVSDNVDATISIINIEPQRS
jgi:DNA-binding beta-propeller fold protein YncE